MEKETVCQVELSGKQYLMIHAITTICDLPTPDTISPVGTNGAFETQQQILQEADAMDNEEDCQKLHQIILKYKDYFAKDSLDCGLIHMVCIPTWPEAPPTFVRQYKILSPVASRLYKISRHQLSELHSFLGMCNNL